jgi:hypothetical protein
LARSSARRPASSLTRDAGAARPAPDALATLPRIREGVEYRPLDELTAARDLFEFAAAALPPSADFDTGLGAWADGSRLVGALLVERAGRSALLWGPVVVPTGIDSPTVERERAPTANPIDVASELVGTAVDLLTRRGVDTVFARPQGLDRVWVRFGFIPVPEGTLPDRLRDRPGAGLFAYRGGSALWSVRDSGSA